MKKIQRWSGQLILAAAFAAKVTAAPNIVYILADDLGYGDVNALNPQGKIKTPQLDRLAAAGLTFTEAHASAAVCTPSRYCILTGRYNWRSTLKEGVLGGFARPLIEPGRLTVAELLKQNGYQTACIGKWHLGFQWSRLSSTNSDEENKIDFTQPIGGGPTTLGFDYFFGISASLDMAPYVFIENDHVTAQPTIARGQLRGAEDEVTRPGPQVPGFTAEAVLPTLTEKAVDYLAQQAGGKPPFFLYLALTSPHAPFATTKEWRGKSGLNPYADFVMETDDCIGKVLAALEKNNLSSNTIILFASDNGCAPAAHIPFLNEHGHDPDAGRRGHKADIYDGGHRIPLIIRWPGRVANGAQTGGFVCLGDLMATCAELLGQKLPDNAGEDSISFLPQLLGKNNPNARQVLVETSNNGSFGLREEHWKLVLCPDSGGWSYPRPGKDNIEGWPRFQLFDLAADPAEKTNVMASHPEIVQRLGTRMRDYIRNGRSTPGATQKNTPVRKWEQTAWLDQFAEMK